VLAGALRGIPIDPSGNPYELTDGRVWISKSSSLWPLPVEPEQLDKRPPS
jgi:hypothetical protein